MDIKKWFEDQNIEPVQDRKDMMDYWTNYELFTYNDLMECLEALFDVAHSYTLLKDKQDITFEEYKVRFFEKHRGDLYVKKHNGEYFSYGQILKEFGKMKESLL